MAQAVGHVQRNHIKCIYPRRGVRATRAVCSFAPPGIKCIERPSPTAGAVGYMLSPLRGSQLRSHFDIPRATDTLPAQPIGALRKSPHGKEKASTPRAWNVRATPPASDGEQGTIDLGRRRHDLLAPALRKT